MLFSGSGPLNYDHTTDDDTVQIEAFVMADQVDVINDEGSSSEVSVIVIKLSDGNGDW